jgi:hypothetical protein
MCWKCTPIFCRHNSTWLRTLRDTRLNTARVISFIACEIAFLRLLSMRGLPLWDLSFKWIHRKNSGGVRLWEHGGQTLLERRGSIKQPLNMFVVSLALWHVAPSCWNQQSCSSSSNKTTNFSTRSLYTAPSTAHSNNMGTTILVCDTAYHTPISSPWSCTSCKVSNHVKPCFICKEGFIRNGHIFANDVRKILKILTALPWVWRP